MKWLLNPPLLCFLIVLQPTLQDHDVTNDDWKKFLESLLQLLSPSFQIGFQSYNAGNWKGLVTNATIDGLTNCSVSEATVDMGYLKFTAGILFEDITLTGVVKSRMNLILVQSPVRVEMEKLNVLMNMTLALYPGNQDKPKYYVFLEDINFNFSADSIKIEAGAGAARLDDLVTELAQPIINEIKPNLLETASSTAKSYSPLIFNGITLDKLKQLILNPL